MTGKVIVIRGDARKLPLPDESVDLIVTSPPYFSLRSYSDGGEHYDGQIGSEPTPAEFIKTLTDCTAEWARVLKPSGSMFVNLGDTYSNYFGPNWKHDRNPGGGERKKRGYRDDLPVSAPATWGVPAKSLIGVPWRYALSCIDNLGLILRRDIIWDKPNGIPESVSDRARTSHEYLFHFVKQQQYYSAVDEIREAHQPGSYARFAPGQKPAGRSRRSAYGGQPAHTMDVDKSLHPLGRLPGSVWKDLWEFPIQPLIGPQCRLVLNGRTMKWFRTWEEGESYMRTIAAPLLWQRRPSLRPEEAHYAAFPMELPRRAIAGWSPAGICTACGQGRKPVRDVPYVHASGFDTRVVPMSKDRVHGHDGRGGQKIRQVYTITGYTCDCTPYTDHPERRRGDNNPHSRDGSRTRSTIDGGAKEHAERIANYPGPVREYAMDGWQPAPTTPGVVLDPFGGTGCAAMVAASLGRIGISVDYSHSYSRFARWRTRDPGERAKAMGVPKPPPPPDIRQEALFDMEDL